MHSRRNLLKAAASIAAARFAASALPVWAATGARARLTSDPFALGVASGEPTTDGFVLWTRIMGLDKTVSPGFEVAEDAAFRHIVRHGRVAAPQARAGAVHLEVAGLRPGRPYFYRFHLGDAISRVGHTTTIAPRANRLRVALTSCQHWEQGWFSAYRDIVAQDADLVLQVGDYIYDKSFGDGPDVRLFGSENPHSLDDYRARYALYRTDPDLAAAHAALPFLVSWDDHEVENDYSGVNGDETADPATFVARRAAAYQAYFEHMPLRPQRIRRNGEYRLYGRTSWGGLATFHMLDTRQYRTPHPCADAGHRGGQVIEGCTQATDPKATMLGREQEAWLRDSLAHENCRWSLLTQQTLFSRLFLPQGRTARYSDIWDGYPATRDRTIASLRQSAVRNPLILGGDVHSFWANDVKADFDRDDAPVVATEVVTSCLASHNGPDALFGRAQKLNPHVRYLDNAHAGYVMLDLSETRAAMTMRAVDDLSDPQSHCHTLADYIVEDGRPGVAR